MLRTVRGLIGAAGWGCVAATGRAAIAEPGSTCHALEVSVTVSPQAKWRTLSTDLTRRLASLPDVDRCARVFVRESGSGVLLEVVTSGGRVARRQVRTLPELLRAAEALLRLPPASQSATTPTASTTAKTATPTATASSAPSTTAPARLDPLELPPADVVSQAGAARPSAHVELGIGASARLGGVPIYAGGGLAASAELVFDAWLLEVEGRWDVADAIVSEPTLDDFVMSSAAVGVHVGRRFKLAGAAIDALLGPTVVSESQDADDGARDVFGSAADFRVNLALRVSRARGTWRPFLALDVEGSPARAVSPRRVDPALPTLPSWCTGLSAGLLWSSP